MAGGEKETLLAFLRYLREAVIAKAAGLTDESASPRACPPEPACCAWCGI